MRNVIVLMVACPLVGYFLFTLPIRLCDLAAWHKLSTKVFPFHSLKTRRRKMKIAFCYLIAFWFGTGKANHWSSPFHDPFWRVRLWWQRLWVRKDEFHSSIDMNIVAMYNMTEAEQDAYRLDLVMRRQIACERDMQG